MRTSSEHLQHLVDVERLEDHAHAEPIELLGHRLIPHDTDGRGAQHDGDAGQLRIHAQQVQRLPAQLLGAFKEEILHDDVGSERLDFVHVQQRHRGRDPVALLFEQLPHQVEDLLRVIDEQDVQLLASGGHDGCLSKRRTSRTEEVRE